MGKGLASREMSKVHPKWLAEPHITGRLWICGVLIPQRWWLIVNSSDKTSRGPTRQIWTYLVIPRLSLCWRRCACVCADCRTACKPISPRLSDLQLRLWAPPAILSSTPPPIGRLYLPTLSGRLHTRTCTPVTLLVETLDTRSGCLGKKKQTGVKKWANS